MRYLTYDEYIDIGGTLEKTAFERVIDRACGIVDYYTQNRLQGEFEPSQRVLACVRDLCDGLNENKANASGGVTSRTQSAGGVSESETYSARTVEDVNAEMGNIVFDYLVSETDGNGTPLLYRGCQK